MAEFNRLACMEWDGRAKMEHAIDRYSVASREYFVYALGHKTF